MCNENFKQCIKRTSKEFSVIVWKLNRFSPVVFNESLDILPKINNVTLNEILVHCKYILLLFIIVNFYISFSEMFNSSFKKFIRRY